MKRSMITLLLNASIILAMIGYSPVYAASTDDIKIMIDGEYIYSDVPPFIENGYTMVPLRAIFEAFGMTVDWQNDSIGVSYHSGDCHINYYIMMSEPRMTVEGSSKNGSLLFSVELNKKLVNDRTFVPVRVIAESFGCKVEWDDKTRTVLIDTENAVIRAPEGRPSEVSNPIMVDRTTMLEKRTGKNPDVEDEVFDDRVKTKMEDEVIRLVNEERAKQGLPELVKNDSLAQVARMKVQDLVDNDYYDHISPVYNSPSEMVKKYAPGIICGGECIGARTSSENAVAGWMNSQAHKDILMKKTPNCVGVGVAKTNDGEFRWVLVVGIQY